MSAAGSRSPVVADATPLRLHGRFARETSAQRVVFGDGAVAAVRAEVERLGAERVLLVATPGRGDLTEPVAAALGPLLAARFEQAAMHTPVDVTERARAAAAAARADAVVSVGGGSAVGLGKALAHHDGLLHLALPTTYAGSEMTPVLGETRDGVKTTRRDAAILPRTVLYDPLLTHGLPVGLSGTSGLNAIAHALEALYAPDGDPLADLAAREGIAALARGLRRIAETPRNPAGRADALYGAWLCASCLASASMGLHHQLCHVLGGSFALPHSETHAVLLPYVAAFNAEAAPVPLAQVADALGAAPEPAERVSGPLAALPIGAAPVAAPLAAPALARLARELGAPRSLGELGFGHEGVETVVEQVLARPYPNPRQVDGEALRALLRAAIEGEAPR